MAKDIDRLVNEVKQNLAYYLDTSVYIPVKEELIGVEHSLGVRKELLKSYIDSELERLKVAIMEHDATCAVATDTITTDTITTDDVANTADDKKAK